MSTLAADSTLVGDYDASCRQAAGHLQRDVHRRRMHFPVLKPIHELLVRQWCILHHFLSARRRASTTTGRCLGYRCVLDGTTLDADEADLILAIAMSLGSAVIFIT